MISPLDLVWFALSPNMFLVVLCLVGLALIMVVVAVMEGHQQ